MTYGGGEHRVCSPPAAPRHTCGAEIPRVFNDRGWQDIFKVGDSQIEDFVYMTHASSEPTIARKGAVQSTTISKQAARARQESGVHSGSLTLRTEGTHS